MAKLFLFAIGGTGVRVVKALTMLLASGVGLKDTDTLIPIIIDPDSANGDLTRTVDILKLYKDIREKTWSPDSKFFSVKIASLDELGEGGFVSDNFKFDIEGVKEQIFKDFIGYSELSKSNQAFISLLFSKGNLHADMDVGFKGNPNIGSVVLNKFKDSGFFKRFAANFEQNDRVFIVSSIFGGTGAAGFPLILKNIRDASHPLPHHAFLNDARIGAVTILPYFSVRNNPSTTIDSNTFISKTRAALSYYARNVTGNESINALYYIGDKVTNEQEGSDGANKQRNRGHFIEVASALAIVDFMAIDNAAMRVENSRAINPKYFEFGLQKESSSIELRDLSKRTFEIIARPLTRFALFKTFLDDHYEEVCKNKNEAFVYEGNNRLTREEIGTRLLANIEQFNRHFSEWLQEMKQSSVSFFMIDTAKKDKDIYNLVVGMPVKESFVSGFIHSRGIDHYRTLLSTVSRNFDHLSSPKKLMAIFSKTTEEIVTSKIKL